MEEEKYGLDVLDNPKKKDDFIKYMIQDYSEKDNHKKQSDLPERCFSLDVNLDNLVNENELIIDTIQQAQKKSIKTKKPSFIVINTPTHSFCLSVFNDKVYIIDSFYSYGGKLEATLNDIKQQNKLNIKIKNININQQSDFVSCPYFTGFNITRFDKWFNENPENFDKLFNEEELPLSIIISVQSIKQLQDKLDIDIRPLNKKGDLEIKFKTETKPKKYFDTKKPKQQIEKLIKYIAYNTQITKLQNHRVSKKSQKMLKKFLEVNKDFTQQEEVAQSPAK